MATKAEEKLQKDPAVVFLRLNQVVIHKPLFEDVGMTAVESVFVHLRRNYTMGCSCLESPCKYQNISS